MNYSTVDRFQGSYLGDIIASHLVASDQSEKQQNDDPGSSCLAARKVLTNMIIQAPELNAEDMADLLCTILTKHEPETDWHGFDRQDSGNISRWQRSNSQGSNSESSNSQSIDTGNYQSDLSLSGHHNHLLIILTLLPLTMFLSDNPWLYQQVIARYQLKSALISEEQEDILIWSCLLTLSLNHQSELSPLNPSLVIQQIFATVTIEQTALGAKLKLVIRAWEQGLGLYQLSEQLFAQGNLPQIAIALSCYCFASTPQDFRLAVERASKLEPNIAWLTTALTGTLSGAYNGMAGIPWSWRAIANQHQNYQQAKQQGLDLLKTWLGVLSIDHNDYDQELKAAAPTNLIQSRKALKIISQKPYQSYQS